MIKIQERGYIEKIKNINETQIKIVFTMYQKSQPMCLSEISRKSGITQQLLNYHIPLLIQDGIVLLVDEFPTKYYILQPFFYDEGIMGSIFDAFIPIIEFISHEESDYSQTTENKEKIIINCIQILIHFFNIEIELIKNDF